MRKSWHDNALYQVFTGVAYQGFVWGSWRERSSSFGELKMLIRLLLCVLLLYGTVFGQSQSGATLRNDFTPLTAAGETSVINTLVANGSQYANRHVFQVGSTSPPVTCTLAVEVRRNSTSAWKDISTGATPDNTNCISTNWFQLTGLFPELRVNLSALVGGEILTENNLATHANWDVTGDLSDSVPGGNLTYAHSTGAGTAIHADEDFDIPEVGGELYVLGLTVGSVAGDPVCEVTNSFAATATSIPMTNGVKAINILAAATPGDFEFSCTSDSGDDAFTFDNITLTAQPTLSVGYTGAM